MNNHVYMMSSNHSPYQEHLQHYSTLPRQIQKKNIINNLQYRQKVKKNKAIKGAKSKKQFLQSEGLKSDFP